MKKTDKKFSMGTALSVGIQCLEALEDLHSIGYLHRDVIFIMFIKLLKNF